jgi:hypothetical protein
VLSLWTAFDPACQAFAGKDVQQETSPMLDRFVRRKIQQTLSSKRIPRRKRLALGIECLEKRELLSVFTPGNLIVLRAGDGTAYNSEAPLFLDEYTTGGTLVQSVSIPNNQPVGGTGNQPITMDLGAAAGNGQLNRSYDGSVLTFNGIDSGINNGTYVKPATPEGSANRVIAVAGADPSAANFLNTTTYGAFYVGDDNRGSIAETATGPLWAVGHPNQAGGAVSQGVHYFATEGPSIGTQVSAGANIRGVTIGFDNRLYFSTAGSSATGLAGVYTESQALPTQATPAHDTQITAALFTASKLGGVWLADMNGTGIISDGDRLYFLDDGTVGGAGTGGLYVSTYNTANPGNHWSTAVRLGDGPVQTGDVSGQLRGLTGTVVSPTEALLTVTEFDNVAGNNSYLMTFDDAGSGVSIANASITTGTTVEITTATPNNFTEGQTVEIDGVGASTGAGALTAGYNGAWSIHVIDSTHFTYNDTNTGASSLIPVNNQGAADATVSPNIITTLADGSVTLGSSTKAAEAIRGVAYAPVAPTSVVLSASATTVSPGTPVTFTATLTNPQVTPTGLVTFIDQNTGTILGQGTITTSGGVTKATLSVTLVGDHFISAYYAGGGAAQLPSATSNIVTVNEAGSTTSTTALAPSLSAAAVGVSVTLTATVSGSGASPTGTVSYYLGSVAVANVIGHATLSTVGGSQVASLTTSSLPLGANTIIAVYDGDNTHASSQNSQTVTIAANATSTLTTSANNVALNATPTYTVTIVGNATLGVPVGTVQFKLTNTFTGATSAIGSAVTLAPGSGNTATASVTSPTLANPGSYFVTVTYNATGASNPYAGFAVDTTTSANGTALIETVKQAFTPGDLVAVQRGDGTTNLGSSGYLVFLDEYTTAGALVQTIALPNVDAGSSHALLLSGQNGAEGLINRSANGQYLTLAGYDINVGHQFVTSTFPFQFGRTIARVDISGNVDTSTVISTTPSSSVPYNPVDVVSNDGKEFWIGSNLPTGDTTESAIEYVGSLGATSATQLGPVDTEAASLAIANGQLYAASNDVSGGSSVGVWQVGTGLPTSATTLSTLPGLQAAYQNAFPNSINPQQLLFLNTNDGTSNNPNVLYIADLANGLLKFWFDGTNWNYGGPGGTFGEKLVFSGGASGVVGTVLSPGASAQVQLYVTGSNVVQANPNQIASFLDQNAYNMGFSSGNFATLAFVGATGSPPSPNGNENFAGLAFAPLYSTSTVVTSSVNPAPLSQAVTFTATVTDTNGAAAPTGTVTFTIDGVAQTPVSVTTSGGITTATLTISNPYLTLGSHTISATYNGDTSTATSASGTLTETVNNTFAPGDLIILRAGDGAVYNSQAPLFLDEYLASGTLVESIPIPNNQVVGGSGNQPITIDLGAAAGNGQLNRSYDGSVLTFDGIDSGINNGTYVLPATPTGSANRVIAVAGNNPSAANFLNTTTYGAFYVGDDNRGSIAETASGPIWSVGHPNQAGGAVSQGVHYFPTEGPSIGTQVSAGANIRGVTIGFDNRLYFSTAGSSATGLAGIYTEAQALPTNPSPPSDTQIVAALFTASKLGGIYLADMNGDGIVDNGDRLYFLDDGTVGGAGTGGLYVSTYNTANPGNHWSTAVRLGDGPVQTGDVSGQLRGLTGTVISPTEALLTATEFDNTASNNSYIMTFDDTGTGVSIANASITTGTTVQITTATPNNFTEGQTVEIDGVGASTGAGALTAGYNGAWSIHVIDSTHFTYNDTNTGASSLTPVNNQGAADATVSPNIITTLADGSVTIGGSTKAAEGLRGVAYAPVAPTGVVLSASATTVSPGTPVTFTATLSNPQVTPTGNVTFIDQNTGTILGQGTISTTGGVTKASFTATLVGNHLVSAYYAGGGAAQLPSATSNSVQVNEAGSTISTTTLTPSLSAAAVGVSVTLTATVSGGGTSPTGTVSYYNGSVSLGNLLGHATLSTVGSSQVATLTTSSLPLGANSIIAVYDGDNTYASSQNSQTVTIAPNATATLTTSANNVALNATPTYTVTINGNATLGVPAGTVQFKLTNTFTGATTSIGGTLTLTPGSGNTATASVTSPALANPGSYFVTVVYTATGATNPYAGFAVNTTTSANGTALIETVKQALKPGDLIAVQRGDGTTNLGSSGYLVFLDEYTQAGTLVQKIALPNLSSGSTNALLLSGQNGAEGLINRSANGQYLTLAGYDISVGHQFVTSTFPFQFGRTIARIDGAGNVDTSTVISTTPASSVPYNPLDVVSQDGNEFWLASNLPNGDTTESGIEYVGGLGATTATQLGPVNTSGASLAIANGQLYASSNDVSGGSSVGVWQVGTGLPTAATTLSTLPGLQAAYQNAFPNTINPQQLLFLNTSDGTSNNPNVLYIADLANGLLKFWFDGASWNYGGPGGTFGEKLVFSGGASGVAGYVVNPGPSAQVQLFVTGSNVVQANPNQIASFLDMNAYNQGFTGGVFTTVAFVGATGSPPSPNGNENFAGLAFAPGYQTTTMLTSSLNPAPSTTNPTFTATVTASTGTPTGTVIFSIDGVAQPAVMLSGGVATFTPSPALGVGPHMITASYSGDVNDATSSASLTQTEVGPFAKYSVTVLGSSTITAGTNFLATVQATDAAGDPVYSYTGPSTVTATSSPSAPSSFPTTVSINAQGLGFFLGSFQKTGSYTISLASGSFTGTSAPVTIVAGGAVKVGFGTQPVNTPTGVTLPSVTVQILDGFGNVVTSDNTDAVTVGIASGPGSFLAGSTTTATVHNGVATFSNLNLAVPGTYTLSEIVPALYTGPSSASFKIAPLQVTSIDPDWGFTLQFNAPFLVNSVTPALYGTGFGASAPVPSVSLSQIKDAAGNPITPVPVEGSVILNTATNSLTFLATNTASEINSGTPILPDGTYKVDILSSGPTGFQGKFPGGGYLDGLGSGTAGSGDYTTTFTVTVGAAHEDIFWLPDTADGPLQPLVAPGNNQIGGGYPLLLDVHHTGATPITDVQVTMSYNPALLTVMSTSTTINGGTFTVTAAAGTAVLHWSGPNLGATAGAPFPVGFITATVPNGSPGSPIYKAKDLLHLSSPSINSGGYAVTTSDGLHEVAFVGDADGNGSYSSADAVLLTRVALQTDSGFTAYPLVDPVIVGDTDGSGFIPADAPLQVNEAGVGFATANLPSPPTPAGAITTPIPNNVDPILSLGARVEGLGARGESIITAEVNLDDAHPEGSTGLIQGHLALTYNPNLFTVSAADVHLGSLLAGSGWRMTPTIDAATGQIAIALSSSTPIANAMGGSLVTIDFHQIVGRVANPSAINLVASVNLNGQVIGTELEDAQGTFTLTPAPVNGFDPRIDNVVSLPETPLVTTPRLAATEEVAARFVVSNQMNESVLEAPTEQSAGVLAATAPALSEDEVPALAAANETAHATPTSMHAEVAFVATPSTVALLGAAPLPSIVAQIVSTSVSSGPGTPGLAAGQRLADQFFQALARATASEAVTPLLLSPTPEGSDGVSSEVSPTWDASLSTLGGLLARARRISPPVEKPLQQPQVDQAALDQAFALAADETDPVVSDE